MIEALVGLLIVCLIVAVVAGVILWAVSLFPVPHPFGQIIRVLVVLIAVLIILSKALPILMAI